MTDTAFDEPEWRALRSAHEARMRPLVDASLQRRSRHEKDPVEDFLFEYYFHPPSHLLRWSPGSARDGFTTRPDDRACGPPRMTVTG